MYQQTEAFFWLPKQAIMGQTCNVMDEDFTVFMSCVSTLLPSFAEWCWQQQEIS
jgi:hypothetical protein